MNDCAYNKLTSVFTSCQANAVAGHAINIRAEVLSLLQSCFIAFGQEAKKVPELMMQTGNAIPTAIRDAATRFGNMTTHPVQLREVPSLKWIAALLETLANPANASAPDAWQTSTSTLASAVMANAVLDLTNLVSSDRQLDWADLFAPARQYGVLFGKRVVGIPWSTVPLLLYTRDDILQANNLTAPATWRELVDVATRLHGAGNMSGICISWCPSARWPGYLYKAMMAAYVQSRGPSRGFFFDPDDLQQTIMNNSAAAEVLSIMKALYSVSADRQLCESSSRAFLAGRCPMLIYGSSHFKFNSHNSSAANLPIRGRVGVHLLPGTEQVLDTRTGQLQRCTTTTCPYAQTVGPAAGSGVRQPARLVNRAVHVLQVLMSINQHSHPDTQLIMYQFLSFLTSTNVSKAMVLDIKDLSFPPARVSHLEVADWVAAGYDEHDTQAFVGAYRDFLASPNPAFELRIPGGDQINTILNNAASSVVNEGQPMAEVMHAAAHDISNVVAGNGGTHMLRTLYLPSIGYTPEEPDAPATQHQVVAHDTKPAASLLAIAIGLPVVGALLLLLTGAVLWREVRKHRREGHHTPTPPPGPGPGTCLLVTDVENSTRLWESLPAEVMDEAMRQHCTLLRSLMAKHSGYESATEGDSFIIAFAGPAAAIKFMHEGQEALMHLPWHSQLLLPGGCGPVWAAPTSSAPHDAASASDASLAYHVPKAGTHSPAGSTALLAESSTNDARLYTIMASAASLDGSMDADSTSSIPSSVGAHPPSRRLSRHSSSARAQAGGFPSRSDWWHAQRKHTGRSQGQLQCQDTSSDAMSWDGSTSSVRAWSTRSAGHSVASAGPTIWQSLAGGWCRVPDAALPPALVSEAGVSGLGPRQLSGPPSAPLPGQQLVLRGLRVRMGLHCGVSEQYIRPNPGSGRMAYAGPILVGAKAVCDMANGGQCVISQAVHERLMASEGGLGTGAFLLLLGQAHIIPEEPPMHLYLCSSAPHLARLAVLPRPGNRLQLVQPGVLDVPLGCSKTIGASAPLLLQVPQPVSNVQLAVAALQVVGGATLQAWNSALYEQAFCMLEAEVRAQLLPQHGGSGGQVLQVSRGDKASVMVVLSGGAAPDSVPCGTQALTWVQRCSVALPGLPWPPELLAHELCEPLSLGCALHHSCSAPMLAPSPLEPHASSGTLPGTSGPSVQLPTASQENSRKQTASMPVLPSCAPQIAPPASGQYHGQQGPPPSLVPAPRTPGCGTFDTQRNSRSEIVASIQQDTPLTRKTSIIPHETRGSSYASAAQQDGTDGQDMQQDMYQRCTSGGRNKLDTQISDVSSAASITIRLPSNITAPAVAPRTEIAEDVDSIQLLPYVEDKRPSSFAMTGSRATTTSAHTSAPVPAIHASLGAAQPTSNHEISRVQSGGSAPAATDDARRSLSQAVAPTAVLVFRGLRLRAAVLTGHLSIKLDPRTGHAMLQKRAAATLDKMLLACKPGQVVSREGWGAGSLTKPRKPAPQPAPRRPRSLDFSSLAPHSPASSGPWTPSTLFKRATSRSRSSSTLQLPLPPGPVPGPAHPSLQDCTQGVAPTRD